MKQKLKLALGIVLVVCLVVLGSAVWIGTHQGSRAVDWKSFKTAKVEFDSDGIPTLEAPTWDALVEAQGYVVASDRLWQMDLMRRFVAGRLSEWYGDNKQTLKLDARRKQENWDAVATQTEADLPADEKRFCEAYAKGVNRFIDDNHYHWGLEYLILRVNPEPWTCKDTVLVYLSMAEDLSGKNDWETYDAVWRLSLGPKWADFIFTQSHPWNEPLFGKKVPIQFPPPAEYLPSKPLTPEERHASAAPINESTGSNAWVWRGKTGHFLANDPHLGISVPMIWYLMRLRVSEKDWVVGAAIPGLQGIVLGMNPHLAWGFTNSMEDVDDNLKEEISDDGKLYVDKITKGQKEFLPVEEKEFFIKVRGHADVTVRARFTKRGPLSRPEHLPAGEYSRQWLVYQRGVARLPLLEIAAATNWTEFNRAFDDMGTPAASVFYLDRQGNMGYRLSGRGVTRKVSGHVPQDAQTGQWTAVEPPEKRLRLYRPASQPVKGADARIVSANQRMWTGDFGHYFCGENRTKRIQQVLDSSDSLRLVDMEKLQRDSTSLYHQALLRWVSQHAIPGDAEEAKLVESWKPWDGSAEGNPVAFTQALHIDGAFRGLLLARLREKFLPEGSKTLEYKWNLDNAWTLAIFQKEKGLSPFGLTEAEVATFLLGKARALGEISPDKAYNMSNRWEAQHPFAGAVPVIGGLFAIDETPQWGYSDLIRMEAHKSGSSVRLVWDLADPAKSSWIMPVGQSGHAGSTHFKDFQPKWFAGQTLKVFADPAHWGF